MIDVVILMKPQFNYVHAYLKCNIQSLDSKAIFIKSDTGMQTVGLALATLKFWKLCQSRRSN